MTRIEIVDIPAASAFQPESGRWFAALRQEGKSQGTLACYARDLVDAAEVLAAILRRPVTCSDLASVGQDEVDAIVRTWMAARASVPTVLRRFAALRGFARHLEVQEGIDCGRLLWAKLPKMIRSPKRALDAEAISAITAEHAGDEGWIELRGRAIFALQSSTAMTTAEIVALNRSQVFGCLGAISIVKTHLIPRIVAASPEAEDLICRYLAVMPFDLGPDDPLFLNARGGRLTARSVQVAFRRRGSELALPVRAGPMTLRHAVGQSLAESGQPPAAVAAALGVSIAAVGRYFAAGR
jgi:integrase/recombinase XerC